MSPLQLTGFPLQKKILKMYCNGETNTICLNHGEIFLYDDPRSLEQGGQCSRVVSAEVVHIRHSIVVPITTRQLQSLVIVRELTSIETRQTVGLAIGWIDIQGFARPVI